jgi:hypothetical protein
MPDDKYDPSTELAELFPDTVNLTIKGRPFHVRPLGVREFGAMSKATTMLLAACSSGNDEAEMYVAEHAGDLIPFVAAATDTPAPDIEAQFARDGAGFLELFEKALDVNRDFFVRCVGMKQGPMLQKVAGMLGRIGPDTSTTLETADIPTAKTTRPPASGSS